jgi:uncharacterized protein (TIGR02246 family)
MLLSCLPNGINKDRPFGGFFKRPRYQYWRRPLTASPITTEIYMRRILLTLALGLSAVTSSSLFAQELSMQSQSKATLASEEREIAALFDRWNAALGTGNPDRVVELYAKDGVLLPTVSNKMRTTPAEIKDYFTHFLESKPRGVINAREVRVLDDNTAVDTGLYTFTLTNTDGSTTTLPARYTFVYEKLNGKWLIISHHSSAMPEETSAGATLH